jgi:hypothetical protein
MVVSAEVNIIPKLKKIEHIFCNTNGHNDERDEETLMIQHQGLCERTQFTKYEVRLRRPACKA